MELEQKFIKDRGFEIEPQVFESLQEINILEAIAISNFLMEVDYDAVSINSFVSTVLGGVTYDKHKNPITFAVEMVVTEDEKIALSDVSLISMDEYLDLINLKLNINELR
jgi:hypothetical protein